MEFKDLHPGQQETLQMIAFSDEIAVEDSKRRHCTTFGYNRGGVPVMIMWIAFTLIMAGFGIIGLTVLGSSLHIKMTPTSLIWCVILPLATAFLLIPFLFLKRRYALWSTFIVLLIFVVGMALCAIGSRIMGGVA